jgi:diguanylate cyclase (GGDEF)-like protein
MWQEQQLIGVLIADDLPAEQAATFGIVANQVALQGSRIGLYQQVESLAVTDALTGLSVRRHFLQRAEEELQRSKRHGLSCTLLMTDLDHFKSKNDEFGHLVGDVVLRDVARLLQRNLREVDMIARYGGEEFILLLIETDLERALPIAQRLKQLVEVHPIRAYDELLSQTISIGVATYPDHAQTVEQLIERADQALYAAKHAGRNQVVVWNDRIGAARGGQPPARS